MAGLCAEEDVEGRGREPGTSGPKEKSDRDEMSERVDLGNGNFAIVCGGRRARKKAAVSKEIQFPATSKELEAAGYRYKYGRPCRRCGVMIEFWVTPARKWAPLERIAEERDGGKLRVSHFSTCPFANEFRRTDTQMDLFGGEKK